MIAEARSLPLRNQDFRKGFLTSAEENHRTTMDLFWSPWAADAAIPLL